MHSVVETADLGDVEHVINLMAGFVLSLKARDVFHHQL
jgi:putative aminopeptidase FrvX